MVNNIFEAPLCAADQCGHYHAEEERKYRYSHVLVTFMRVNIGRRTMYGSYGGHILRVMLCNTYTYIIYGISLHYAIRIKIHVRLGKKVSQQIILI